LGALWGQSWFRIAFVSLVLSTLNWKESIMAYLEKRNQTYRLVFRLDGKKFSRSAKTKDRRAAELALAKLQDGLRRVEMGLLELDPNDDIFNTLLSAGSVRSKVTAKKQFSIGQLLDQYEASIPADTIEENTRSMISTHVRHLKRTFGVRLRASSIDLSTLQNYINTRGKEKGIHGKQLSPVTIRKEISTLFTAWSWAKESSLVTTDLPRKSRLRYPKLAEKPPFKSYSEISRLIDKCKLDENDQKKYWDCLYLNDVEIAQLAAETLKAQTPLAIRTMIVTAAYTGARRSELLRSQIEDFDMELGFLTIREKKRVRSQHSTRRVPICEALRPVLESWFDEHPGGTHTFTIDSTPITRDQAHGYFVRTFQKTKWSVLRGWHVFPDPDEPTQKPCSDASRSSNPNRFRFA
jgi:integrase